MDIVWNRYYLIIGWWGVPRVPGAYKALLRQNLDTNQLHNKKIQFVTPFGIFQLGALFTQGI